MTSKQYSDLGIAIRSALDGNLYVGSFAAELIGESYPLTKSLWDVVFESYTDEELGRKMEAWDEQTHKPE